MDRPTARPPRSLARQAAAPKLQNRNTSGKEGRKASRQAGERERAFPPAELLPPFPRAPVVSAAGTTRKSCHGNGIEPAQPAGSRFSAEEQVKGGKKERREKEGRLSKNSCCRGGKRRNAEEGAPLLRSAHHRCRREVRGSTLAHPPLPVLPIIALRCSTSEGGELGKGSKSPPSHSPPVLISVTQKTAPCLPFSRAQCL